MSTRLNNFSILWNNMNNILSSMTPFVPIKFSSEAGCEGKKSAENSYFVLEDLWESFKEWSAYGVEVPLVLREEDDVMQYFVPFLSAIQLFVADEGLSGTPKEEPNKVLFQYFERESPYIRQPLNDMISTLAIDRPYLRSLKSCDILPSSWFSVAWYPIYRIPVGSTLKSVEASFLTFHNLATSFKSENKPEEALKMPLPIFGLTTYKLNESILPLPKAWESRELNALLKAADVWLENLEVIHHHDHNYFSRNGKQWIDY